MKKVKGYLTNDDVFFGTKEEAELHEATRVLEICTSQLHLRTDAVLGLINVLSNEITRYILARDDVKDKANAKSRITEYPADNNPPEGGTVSVLEFSPRGFESVSDIRDSKRPEEVRHYSPLDGIGSWGDDASGIRGSEDLADVADPRTSRTRETDSEEDIRDGTVESLYKGESRK